MKQGEFNKNLYDNRFEAMDQFRTEFYQIFCREFLHRYIPTTSHVLEIGAGYCELINAVQAEHKVALDVNPDVCTYAASDVTPVCGSVEKIADIDGTFDIIIVNNVLEHLTRTEIVNTLITVRKLLSISGKLVLIQPNIRYCYQNFWMFFDHITPLDDRAIVELLRSLGYQIIEVKPKFLPYTTKSKLPQGMNFVKIYLRIPFLWKIFGKQMFIVAKRDA